MKALSALDARRLVEQEPNLTVLEVLPEDFFDDWHLPRAQNVPLDDDFERNARAAAPDPSGPVLVYCLDRNCDAATKAAKRLERAGHTDVYVLSGGKIEWKEHGLPTG